jgi:hypothetical protein
MTLAVYPGEPGQYWLLWALEDACDLDKRVFGYFSNNQPDGTTIHVYPACPWLNITRLRHPEPQRSKLRFSQSIYPIAKNRSKDRITMR